MASHADRQPAAQIKIPGLQLVWRSLAAPEAKWHLALLGYSFKGTPRRLMIHVSLRGVLLWGTGAAVSVYFLGAAALSWLWGRNPYNAITYADLVLPSRWSQLREKRGQGQLDEGVHEIRQGKYATGIMLINSGLAKKPSDLRGRMILAQAFINMGYLHRGLQLLQDGLSYGAISKAYREAFFRLTGYLEDYPAALAAADLIESRLSPEDSTPHRWLLNQRVIALEKLQRDDEIARLRQAFKDSPSFALEAAWARMQARHGRPADALRAIAGDPGRFGLPADRCQLQISLALAAGDRAAVTAALREWQMLEPANFPPRVEEIVALIQLGEKTQARGQLQRLFLLFGRDPKIAILLFKRLGELPDGSWLLQARQESTDAGITSRSLDILYVQGLIMTGRLAEAMAQFNLTADAIRTAKVNDGNWSEGTRLLLNLLTGDSPSARTQLLDFCSHQQLNPEAFRFLLRSLRQNGVTGIDEEVAALARNRFPSFQDVIPASLAAAGAPFPATAETGAPAYRSEAEARVELRTLDRELEQGDYGSAAAHLRRLNRAGFAGLKAELLTRKIQLHGGLGELVELTAALQLYLASPEANQAWLRGVIIAWNNESHRTAP